MSIIGDMRVSSVEKLDSGLNVVFSKGDDEVVKSFRVHSLKDPEFSEVAAYTARKIIREAERDFAFIESGRDKEKYKLLCRDINFWSDEADEDEIRLISEMVEKGK